MTSREPSRPALLAELDDLRRRLDTLERMGRGYRWDPVAGTLEVPAELVAASLSVAGAVSLPGLAGYRLHTVVTYTSSGSFVKADHAGMRAVRVTAVGGGGGGRGTSTAHDSGPGGGAGATAVKHLVLAGALSSSETVTVGGGGNGNNGTGGSGATSSFGSHCVAGGGEGGGALTTVHGGRGATTGTGDLLIAGGEGQSVIDKGAYSSLTMPGGLGGASSMGGGGEGAPARAANRNGGAGNAPGSGGGGGFSRSGTAVTGGDGASGVVIVEVYV